MEIQIQSAPWVQFTKINDLSELWRNQMQHNAAHNFSNERCQIHGHVGGIIYL